MVEYIPERGDVVWVSLGSTFGHEQKGRRPALVISPKNYNRLVGLSLICPLTSVIKGYPYEVSIGTRGVVLSDQIRSVAWKDRQVRYITSLPSNILAEVFNKIKTLLDI